MKASRIDERLKLLFLREASEETKVYMNDSRICPSS